MMQIINHKDFLMLPLYGKDALAVLLVGLTALKGYKVWIAAGTLLGLYRDKQFIPHDTDIDVAIVGNWSQEMPEEFELIRTVTDVDRDLQYQTAFMHKPTQIIFDVFNHQPYDETHFQNRRENDEIIFTDRSIVEPLSEIKYKGHKFPCPNDLDKYLTTWYGDWRTPVKGGKRDWDKCR